MNIARNTNDIPINGIFANKSMRAMRPTSIDRMTVVPVNTFRRYGGGRMELRAVGVGRDPVAQGDREEDHRACRRPRVLRLPRRALDPPAHHDPDRSAFATVRLRQCVTKGPARGPPESRGRSSSS